MISEQENIQCLCRNDIVKLVFNDSGKFNGNTKEKYNYIFDCTNHLPMDVKWAERIYHFRDKLFLEDLSDKFRKI